MINLFEENWLPYYPMTTEGGGVERYNQSIMNITVFLNRAIGFTPNELYETK